MGGPGLPRTSPGGCRRRRRYGCVWDSLIQGTGTPRAGWRNPRTADTRAKGFLRGARPGAGEARGNELNRKYCNAFARSYKDEVLPSAAVVDIEKLEMLNDENKLEMLFYRPQEEANSNIVRLSLFHKDEPIHLSDVMPMLENFGLRNLA